jgi:hypothetical protein
MAQAWSENLQAQIDDLLNDDEVEEFMLYGYLGDQLQNAFELAIKKKQ